MVSKSEIFGIMKTLLDAHTMGIHASSALLRDCGYQVIIAPAEIQDALDKIYDEGSQRKIAEWIRSNHIRRLGI